MYELGNLCHWALWHADALCRIHICLQLYQFWLVRQGYWCQSPSWRSDCDCVCLIIYWACGVKWIRGKPEVAQLCGCSAVSDSAERASGGTVYGTFSHIFLISSFPLRLFWIPLLSLLVWWSICSLFVYYHISSPNVHSVLSFLFTLFSPFCVLPIPFLFSYFSLFPLTIDSLPCGA